jgi:predicted SAM-dependent methyltransferase
MNSVLAQDEIKLNIGCGISGIPGWCNIDNSPTIPLSRVPLGRRLFRTPAWPRDVQRIDVLRGLPFSDAAISHIYSSHLLQSLTYDESVALMKESFRVLKPGGVLRVVVPDLAIVVSDYLADPDPLASHKLMRRLSIQANAIRGLLGRGRGYEQMFDGRSLAQLFLEAGFNNPAVCSFKQSRIPQIDDLELEERRRESLYMESAK